MQTTLHSTSTRRMTAKDTNSGDVSPASSANSPTTAAKRGGWSTHCGCHGSRAWVTGLGITPPPGGYPSR